MKTREKENEKKVKEKKKVKKKRREKKRKKGNLLTMGLLIPLAPAVVYDFIGWAFFVVVDARSGCGLASNTDRDPGRREPDANRDKNCDVGSCIGMDG